MVPHAIKRIGMPKQHQNTMGHERTVPKACCGVLKQSFQESKIVTNQRKVSNIEKFRNPIHTIAPIL